MKTIVAAAAILSSLAGPATTAFAFQPSSSFSSAERRSTRTALQISRRDILTDTPSKLVSAAAAALLTALSNPSYANADAAAIKDSLGKHGRNDSIFYIAQY